jgi:cytochrome c oxidase assembly protein subunit 15
MTKIPNGKKSLYGTFSLITLIAVYLLILVGGVVRTTGSGMGCPDWPKCFNQWVPPMSEAELPENYREIYSDYRAEKNVRFARYLNLLGMEATADQLLSDESIKEERPFNKYNTLIEYANRLLGALIGLFILLTFVFSIRYFNSDRVIFYTSLATLLLVIFQGWIGSIVVSTNLVPWMVTIHMLLAIVIVFLLTFLVYRSRFAHRDARVVKSKMLIQGLVILAIFTMVIQIIFGTQVREEIDVVASALGENQRTVWIASLGEEFFVHRSFSWVILVVNLALFYLLWKQRVSMNVMWSILLLILLSVLTGVIMAYLGMPAFVQPVHLLLGTVIIGLHFFLFLQLKNQKTVESVKI